MAEIETKMCRICLTTNENNIISDSSCYNEFFTQVMSVKDLNECLWLCIWCRASLKKAKALFTLAMKSEKARQYKFTTELPNKTKTLHTLNYTHNPHIDIPPLILKSDNEIKKEPEEFTNTIHEIQIEIEIPLKNDTEALKYNENEITDKNKEETNEISNSEQESIIENEIPTKKRRKEFNFKEMKFEIEYLNLVEQFKEVEMKKVKYKDYKFQCRECGMGYLTSEAFEEHKIRHSELAGPYSCKICNLHYKSQDILTQHMLAHKRRFKCLICNAMLYRCSHCIAHRYRCGAVEQPSACEECSKVFSNEHSLKIHKKIHTKEKSHCCVECGKKFGSKQHLTVHMRTHSGVKPFSCAHCSSSFSTNSNLRAHSALHIESAQYYCVECNTYYKTEKSLKRHYKESARHGTAKTDEYSCKECSKQFSSEKSLSYHINTCHSTEHRCTECDKIFSNNSNLNKHVKCIHTAK